MYYKVDMERTLMTHLYYGDPTEVFSLQLAKTLVDSGADILEIGIPYTDPVCDGEVFQRACQRGLNNGINPYKVLDGIKKWRKQGIRKPIYLTSYYGPIFKIGVEKFTRLAKDAGVNGLIVPDLLLEEQEDLGKYIARVRPLGNLRSDPLSLVQFATVYSSRERLLKICKESNDFIYGMSLPGVTGDEGDKYEKVHKLIDDIKSISDKKVYIGFGIKSGEDAKKIIRYGADGIIIGSKIGRIYGKNLKDPFSTLAEISKFIKQIKGSTI